MKKVPKGRPGYYHSEKIRRGIITLISFLIPLTIFFSGFAYYHTRKNLLTIVAVVGILPAARAAVSWIMVMLASDCPKQILQITKKAEEKLLCAYELTVTCYEGKAALDALAVCGTEIAAYTSSKDANLIALIEKHISRTLMQNGLYHRNVKIFQNEGRYEVRLKDLCQDPEKYRSALRDTPDEKNPDLSSDERTLELIKAISV